MSSAPRGAQKPAPLHALPPEVADRLGFYVYALKDPRGGAGRIFYVGKGIGQRLVAHGREAYLAHDPSEPEKTRLIREIRGDGFEPGIDIVRHGLASAEEALEVEGALIDCLPGLVNRVRGHNVDRGRAPVEELATRYGAPPLETEEPLLLIRLSPWVEDPDPDTGRQGHGFRPGMTIHELYQSTRAWWRVDLERVSRDQIRYAVAIFEGVTRGLFQIAGWPLSRPERRGFVGAPVTEGPLWEQLVGPLGHRIAFARHAQGPVAYWPLPKDR